MKKFAVIVLMLVYSLSSSGMSVTFHYCCGKLDNITFTSSYKNKCLDDKHFSKQKCCDNKKLDLKLKADQERSIKQLNLSISQNVFIFPTHPPVFSSFRQKPVCELPTGPPLVTHFVPLFILNQVFRIWWINDCFNHADNFFDLSALLFNSLSLFLKNEKINNF